MQETKGYATSIWLNFGFTFQASPFVIDQAPSLEEAKEDTCGKMELWYDMTTPRKQKFPFIMALNSMTEYHSTVLQYVSAYSYSRF